MIATMKPEISIAAAATKSKGGFSVIPIIVSAIARTAHIRETNNSEKAKEKYLFINSHWLFLTLEKPDKCGDQADNGGTNSDNKEPRAH
jgi:hypothetical protein